MPVDDPTQRWELSSEFASVSLACDDDGNGPRLKIVDLRTGHVGFLDPLELETLAWLPEGGLNRLLDPSFHRWRDPHGDDTHGDDTHGDDTHGDDPTRETV